MLRKSAGDDAQQSRKHRFYSVTAGIIFTQFYTKYSLWRVMAFNQNSNTDLCKNNPFFMKPGTSIDFFMIMQVSQIKLCLQHFKSEVHYTVMVYNSIFCLTIRWKIKFRKRGHKATLKFSLVPVSDIIFLGTYHRNFLHIYNFCDSVSLHSTSE